MRVPARICVALVAALLLTVAGCGGKKTVTFTSTNWGTLEVGASKYNGAHVDITGQVFLVDLEQPDATWFGIYADVKGLTWRTIVEVPRPNFMIQENQIVHVVGVVDQTLPKPDSVLGFDVEPVILASKATFIARPPG